MPTTHAVTVWDLRRGWKLHKERLGSHPTAIRFHRACSWLDRAEKLNQTADADLLLINQWIALDSPYGQWDARANEPQPDRESWRCFVSQVLKLDSSGHITLDLYNELLAQLGQVPIERVDFGKVDSTAATSQPGLFSGSWSDDVIRRRLDNQIEIRDDELFGTGGLDDRRLRQFIHDRRMFL